MTPSNISPLHFCIGICALHINAFPSLAINIAIRDHKPISTAATFIAICVILWLKSLSHTLKFSLSDHIPTSIGNDHHTEIHNPVYSSPSSVLSNVNMQKRGLFVGFYDTIMVLHYRISSKTLAPLII